MFLDHERSKEKYYKYRDTRQELMKLLRESEPNTGASMTRLFKKFVKHDQDKITRKTLQCITKFELIRGDLQKLDVQKLTTHK